MQIPINDYRLIKKPMSNADILTIGYGAREIKAFLGVLVDICSLARGK